MKEMAMLERSDAVVHLGIDATGCVRVTLDDDAGRVTVALAPDWRRPRRPVPLGATLLEAFGAAAAARFAAWAEHPVQPDDEPEPEIVFPYRSPVVGPQAITALLNAWRDLDEFRLRLHEIHARTATTSSPDREVTAEVRGGNIVAVHVDPRWAQATRDSEIERHAGQVMSAALVMIADAPERALEGCPDLRAVLATEPSALQFAVAAPPADPIPHRRSAQHTHDLLSPTHDWTGEHP